MKKIILYIEIIILVAIILLCGYELWKVSEQYVQEEKVREEMLKYYPQNYERSIECYLENVSETNENKFIVNLQNDINKDIVGWITIPSTKINYPFVIAINNEFYLRRDIHKKKANAGTIFMDYRCNKNFTDFNNIMYGHNMKEGGGMFSELKLFADKEFFETNRYGILFLEDKTYILEIFAYMLVKSNDRVVYKTSVEENELFEYAKKAAKNYREPEIKGNIVTLSTCSYEFDNARIILMACLKRDGAFSDKI